MSSVSQIINRYLLQVSPSVKNENNDYKYPYIYNPIIINNNKEDDKKDKKKNNTFEKIILSGVVGVMSFFTVKTYTSYTIIEDDIKECDNYKLKDILYQFRSTKIWSIINWLLMLSGTGISLLSLFSITNVGGVPLICVGIISSGIRCGVWETKKEIIRIKLENLYNQVNNPPPYNQFN